nr:MAG TPA: hypothetical protein [Bacteriophage sp.]
MCMRFVRMAMFWKMFLSNYEFIVLIQLRFIVSYLIYCRHSFNKFSH